MSLRVRIIALLFLVHFVAAPLFPQVPSWRMFAYARPQQRWELTDRTGALVNLRDHAPAHAYLLDRSLVERLAEFICRRQPERAPYQLREESSDAGIVTITAPACASTR